MTKISAIAESGAKIPTKQIPILRRQLVGELQRLRDGITGTALHLAGFARQKNKEAPANDEIRRDPISAVLKLQNPLCPEIETLIYQYRLRALALLALSSKNRRDGKHEQSTHLSESPNRPSRFRLPAVEGSAALGDIIEQNILATLEAQGAICTLDFIREEIFRDWPADSWREVEALIEWLVRYQIIEEKNDNPQSGVYFVRGANYEARKRQLFDAQQNRRSRRRQGARS